MYIHYYSDRHYADSHVHIHTCSFLLQILYKIIQEWPTALYNPQAVINAVEVGYMYIHNYKQFMYACILSGAYEPPKAARSVQLP